MILVNIQISNWFQNNFIKTIYVGAHAWDYAAAEFIVREAGGVIIDPSGGPFDLMSRRLLAAANQELADQLVKELVQYYPSPRDDC